MRTAAKTEEEMEEEVKGSEEGGRRETKEINQGMEIDEGDKEAGGNRLTSAAVRKEGPWRARSGAMKVATTKKGGRRGSSVGEDKGRGWQPRRKGWQQTAATAVDLEMEAKTRRGGDGRPMTREGLRRREREEWEATVMVEETGRTVKADGRSTTASAAGEIKGEKMEKKRRSMTLVEETGRGGKNLETIRGTLQWRGAQLRRQRQQLRRWRMSGRRRRC